MEIELRNEKIVFKPETEFEENAVLAFINKNSNKSLFSTIDIIPLKE